MKIMDYKFLQQIHLTFMLLLQGIKHLFLLFYTPFHKHFIFFLFIVGLVLFLDPVF